MQALPEYLVEAKARQLFDKDLAVNKYRWEEAEESVRRGYMEIAKTLLTALATQSDIKH